MSGGGDGVSGLPNAGTLSDGDDDTSTSSISNCPLDTVGTVGRDKYAVSKLTGGKYTERKTFVK